MTLNDNNTLISNIPIKNNIIFLTTLENKQYIDKPYKEYLPIYYDSVMLHCSCLAPNFPGE